MIIKKNRAGESDEMISKLRSCSPGGTLTFHNSVLTIFMLLLESEGSSWSDVGVKRVNLVDGEVDAGILKALLSLIRQT